MTIDMASFFLGLAVAALVGAAWEFGQQRAIRTCRRIARHGRSLDLVFFEDAERDATVERPKPTAASVTPFQESQR